MKIFKKTIAVLLVSLMVISIMPMQALALKLEDVTFLPNNGIWILPYYEADEDVSGENEYCTWSYNAETKTVYINGTNIESSQYAYKRALYNIFDDEDAKDKYSAMLPLYNTSIQVDGEEAEQYCTIDFEHLIIGKDVVNFDSHISKDYYSNLKDIIFEEGSKLEKIGDYAFYKCPVESIELPNTVKSIGNSAFAYSSIKSFTIPETAINLGKDIFSYSSVERVDFPTNISRVPNGFFKGCENVTSLDFLGPNITSIDSYAFSECPNITSLDFTNTNITAIYTYAFQFCENLTTIRFNSQTDFLSGFNDCTKLERIDFPENLTQIGNYAFQNDESTKFSPIPNSVNKIYWSAFANSGIEEFVMETDEEDVSIGGNAFFSCKKLKKVVLPEKLSCINDRCFSGSSIKKLVVPDAVLSIGYDAFRNSSLEEITFGKNSNLTGIGEKAFMNCINLTSIDIPKWTNGIDNKAFCGDVNLKRVLVYSNYVEINSNSFALSDSNTKENCIDVIYGYSDSTTQTFAENKGIRFATFAELPDLDESEGTYENADKGTWQNGTWTYDETTSRLIIRGTGTLNESFKDSNGNSLNIKNYIIERDIKNIAINDGITAIADDMFYIESGLNTNSFYLSNTLKTIGASAFRNVNVKSIKFNSEIESIGKNAFYGSSVTSIDLSGTKLTTINQYTFANCQNLAKVTLPDTLTQIDEGAFYSTALTSVDIPKSVTVLGKKAFGNCLSLKNIKITNDDISIYTDNTTKSNNAFGYDEVGNIINIPVKYSYYVSINETITVDANIGSTAFDYAENNNFIVYNENQKADKVGYIQKKIPARWYYFEDTKTLYIEGNYSLAKSRIQYATNKYIIFGDDGDFCYDDGTKVENLEVDLLYICSGVQIANAKFSQINPKYVHFPNTINTIGDEAFKKADNLKIIAIPDSVTSVGYSAFEDCRSLERITFSKNQNRINNNCFKNCTSLKEIDLANVEIIGGNAFYYCNSLEEIFIPNTVSIIESNAFNKCLSVKKITLGNGLERIGSDAFCDMPFCSTIVLNLEYDPNSNSLTYSSAFKNIGFSTTGVELVVSDDVKIIDFKGFTYLYDNYNSTKITAIRFGKNSTNFGSFPDMRFVKEITVSPENKNMYTYEGNVYYNKTLIMANPNILTVRIKDGTTKIGDEAFWKSNAMQISMPDTVTSIGAFAFYQCENLKRVNLSSRLLSVDNNAFEGCKSLLTIKFPSITNSIGGRCFNNCTSLQSAILPNWITKIDEFTFHGCSSLKAIVIPKLVNTIDQYAFAGCKNIKNIFVPKTVTNLKLTWITTYSTVTIHTPNSSTTYDWAKNHNVKYVGYASTTAFNEVCDAQLEKDGEFVDICKDGHGQTEYLTVYKPDCENDGYIIGVCEFCSTLIEEIHETATGHNYVLTADIPATTTTKGIKQYTCTNCRETYCDYTEPLEESAIPTTHNVTAKVIYSTNGKLKGEAPVRRADVVIDGKTVATTDNDGMFTISLETGSYTVEIKYAYGYTRTVGIVVEDEDVNFIQPIDIVGCDFNKDGKIDSEDTEMFSLVLSSQANDPAYLDYCDFDHNGYINATDYAIIRSFNGTTADTYEYSIITIKK